MQPLAVRIEYPDWVGIVARTGTPREAIAKTNGAIAKALDNAQVKDLYARLAAEPVSASPEMFRQLIESEVERWAALARAAHIRVE